VDSKKGTAQKKIFKITVKGFDSSGKSVTLGDVSFDLS
jgi:hypothetical protein